MPTEEKRMTIELTDWFGGAVQPVRKGVYERQGNYSNSYSMWNGASWCAYCYTVDEAAENSNPSAYQFWSWRGIFKEEKLEPTTASSYFHSLWSKAVGTPEYSKDEWKYFAKELEKHGVIV